MCSLALISVNFLFFFFFKDGIGGIRDASEKKVKRHLEREDLGSEGRRDKKHTHKRQKMNKKSLQRRAASTSSSPRSDFSQSDDSDEEIVTCPAERCQQPEGDEVRKPRHSYAKKVRFITNDYHHVH